VLKGGPHDCVVLLIHADEPELSIERVRALLGTTHFRAGKVIRRAFLLLSYDPLTKSETCPFIELAFMESG